MYYDEDEEPITILVQVNKKDSLKGIDGYQLAKFLKSFSEIYTGIRIRVFFIGENPLLYMDELQHVLKYRAYNMYTCILVKMSYKADRKDLETLDKFDKIFVSLKNKCDNEELQSLIYCCDKIKTKSKYIAHFEDNEELPEEKMVALIRVAKKLGFDTLSFSRIEELGFESFKQISDLKQKIECFNRTLDDVDYYIEADGTVLKTEDLNFRSSIFKPISSMFFPEKS